jgi:hypothetical protein
MHDGLAKVVKHILATKADVVALQVCECVLPENIVSSYVRSGNVN